MQLKETGAGEVTVWLAEMSITIGGTDEGEVAQRKEREGIIYTLCKHPSSRHTTNSLNNWQLRVHLTILLLPIAGGTNGGHYSIQAQCVVALLRYGQSLPISFITPSFNDKWASKWESLQVDSGQQGRQYTKCVGVLPTSR